MIRRVCVRTPPPHGALHTPLPAGSQGPYSHSGRQLSAPQGAVSLSTGHRAPAPTAATTIPRVLNLVPVPSHAPQPDHGDHSETSQSTEQDSTLHATYRLDGPQAASSGPVHFGHNTVRACRFVPPPHGFVHSPTSSQGPIVHSAAHGPRMHGTY